MIPNAIILPQADRDIDEAFAWYAATASPEVALGFLSAVAGVIASLPAMPGIGRPWLFRRPANEGLRSLPVPRFGRYLVFYRHTTATVEVVRILHGMRDLQRILEARP